MILIDIAGYTLPALLCTFMRQSTLRYSLLPAFFLLTTLMFPGYSRAQSGEITAEPTATTNCKLPEFHPRWVYGEMEFLASDAMQGRGSGTHDEMLAAIYVASRLHEFGISPAGDQGYLQEGEIPADPSRHFGIGPHAGHTWNAIGILHGTDPVLKDQAIVLSAHLDHLGLGTAVNGDSIYNGADDDASGVTAVLELARALGECERPRRTIIFALFGSEELGGYGNRYFLEHPPMPLDHIVANLEFEMIGRADAAIAKDQLWLTGFERSNLGAELAKHGAHLVKDPHPEQNFFQRSDNYALAKHGIIAHTVSSFGLHKDYHQPSDELSRIDFDHMISAIQSMIGPVEWLSNTDWKPEWNKGGRP